jgi:pyruvate formate lyase activating enzyme
VLRAAVRAKREFGCHVEIVTNVIPTLNDTEAMLRDVAVWVRDVLGPETPWHVTRFVPYLELAHLPVTPIRTLERAVEIGLGCAVRRQCPYEESTVCRTVNGCSCDAPATD